MDYKDVIVYCFIAIAGSVGGCVSLDNPPAGVSDHAHSFCSIHGGLAQIYKKQKDSNVKHWEWEAECEDGTTFLYSKHVK